MDIRITNALRRLIDLGRSYEDRAPEAIRARVRRKIVHPMRVLAHVRRILAEERPGPELALAAEIAAILHDIGRFAQLVDLRTVDDAAAYDHGAEGARILAEGDILDGLNGHWRAAIIEAVRLHNRAALPEAMDPDARLVAEMVRDADKLDAVRNSVNGLLHKELTGRAIKYGITVHDTEVSPDAVRRTRERRLIPYTSMRWSNDFVLFLCAWVHDLHFAYAYNRLIDSGHFEQLLDMLPDQGPFPELKAQLRADLHRLAGRG
ncbi:HD domain-containing protein [Desulfovibrio sp. Huiquan2017]|uniref:HD domain-containing protein n=1 Tax=Desulfovibrio sp. Huiquan2017 TaxID=2816861 RepID=UPI001A927DF0|nr:HD domain-containing protein [Desulfovibrio sp. Huiquan2017]